MASRINLDDPDTLNAFLGRIGGAQVPKTQKDQSSSYQNQTLSASATEFTPASEKEEPHHSNEGTPAASPDLGSTKNSIKDLSSSPVKTDETGELRLLDSKFAPKGNQVNQVPPFTSIKALAPKNVNTAIMRSKPPVPVMTPTQIRLLEKKETIIPPSFESDVLENFRKQNMSTQHIHMQDDSSKAEARNNSENTVKVEDTVPDHENEENTSQSSATVPFPDIEQTTLNVDINVDDSTNSVPNKDKNHDVTEAIHEESSYDAPIQELNIEASPVATVPEKDDGKQDGALAEAKEELQKKVAGLDLNIPPAVKATLPKASSTSEEDRKHLTHFQSWGNPEPRSKAKSRVRKIILSNLPQMADNTLVQSLIHGGIIETFKLFGPTETIPTSMAHVHFTTGDAADKYFEKYPNGLGFTFKGKKYTAFVDKGRDVDVISSVLESYLECGATRVVQATGADEDWGMRALQKLAEGKSRKVENIIDTYRNETRTIVFRFTNISDAVQFKAYLVRDYDWEHCNIQFIDDPCEKAASVHPE